MCFSFPLPIKSPTDPPFCHVALGAFTPPSSSFLHLSYTCRAFPTMKRSVFTAGGRSRLLRTLHNIRVTLLCGLLTFVVLRSSLGAGKFGTPAQDFDEIKHQLHRFKLRRQQKLLLVRERTDSTLHKDTSRSTLSLSTYETHADNAVRGPAFDNGVGFLEWFKQKHLPAWPRILLVTKRSRSCKSAISAQFLLRFLKNKIDYCHMHGIEIVYEAGFANTSSSADFLQELMLSHSKVEWIWWMDRFTVFTDISPPTLAAYAGYNVVCGARGALMSNDGELNTWEKMWAGGSFLVRNCEWSHSYFRNEGRMRMPVAAGELYLDTRMAAYEPGVRNSQARPPFVMQFGSCGICGGDSIGSGCLTDMESVLHVVERQKMQVGFI